MKAAFLLSALCMGQVGSYDLAQAEALRAGKPLVVGVGCAPPNGEWVVSMVRAMQGHKGPCIIVATIIRGQLSPVDTMPATATADDIRAAIPKKVEKAPPPKKWNPYDQPDFQERMRRQTISSRSVRGGNC